MAAFPRGQRRNFATAFVAPPERPGSQGEAARQPTLVTGQGRPVRAHRGTEPGQWALMAAVGLGISGVVALAVILGSAWLWRAGMPPVEPAAGALAADAEPAAPTLAASDVLAPGVPSTVSSAEPKPGVHSAKDRGQSAVATKTDSPPVVKARILDTGAVLPPARIPVAAAPVLVAPVVVAPVVVAPGPVVPPPPPGGTVRVEGDAKVALVGADNDRRKAGKDTPEGTYTVEATFRNGVVISLTNPLRVQPGTSTVVKCDQDLETCWIYK